MRRKFITRFQGPYTVAERITAVNYSITKNGSSQTVHIDRLRKVVKDDNVDVWKNDLHLAEDELNMINDLQSKLVAMKTQTQSNIDKLAAELLIEEQHAYAALQQ